MLRAVVLATRLDLALDPPVAASIRRNQALIATAAPARLLEEYYRILRSGAAEATFAALRESGLLRHITPELHRPSAALADSLRALDQYRARFTAAPETLTNSLLVGTLLSPLGLVGRRPPRPDGDEGEAREPRTSLGILPIARRDVEHLRQIAALRRRLADLGAPPRAQHNVMGRPIFGEALLWLEIHGRQPEVVEHWRAAAAQQAPAGPVDERPAPPGRRRRRRRRRPRRSRSRE